MNLGRLHPAPVLNINFRVKSNCLSLFSVLVLFICFQVILPPSVYAATQCEALFKKTKKEIVTDLLATALSQKSPDLAKVFSKAPLLEKDPLVQAVSTAVAKAKSFYDENLLGLNIELDLSIQEHDGFLIVAVPWIRTSLEKASRSEGLNRHFYKIIAGLLLGSRERFTQKSELRTLILVGNNVVNPMLRSELPQKGFESDHGLFHQLNLNIR